jgi:UDP-N-acetylglucosamine diphosphorylase / glucose-1-phosphate thymidylyltransferase / UDP-N-acetylgalactosamine diphosphorylase / glucosamine-1-phosphate N-acetyltransferase / galactosamine-1-phosphate N-acetyltransferase
VSIVVFEDERWTAFAPVSQTRHLAQLIVGPDTILQGLAAKADDGELALAGRDYLKDVVREETKLEYNAPLDAWALLVNGRINPSLDLERWTSRRGGGGFVVMDRGQVAIASLGAEANEILFSEDGTVSQASLISLTKGLERMESPEPLLFAYPWEMMANNGAAIEASAAREGLKAVKAGRAAKKQRAGDASRQKGGKVSKAKKAKGRLIVSQDAQVDDFVSLDTSRGPIIIEERVHIESFSKVSGPCFIGRDTVLHAALVREGTTIGENCRIGGEIENSIIYPYTNKAHLGFLGHAIVGSWVNLGAGSVTSDLKNTYGTVKVKRGGERVDSGLVKLGPMIGDMAKVSIGTMVYGGNSIGVSARCGGLVDRDVPDFVQLIGGTASELRLDALMITQSRMMERRGLSLSDARKRLIEYLHRTSVKEEEPARAAIGAPVGAAQEQRRDTSAHAV